MEKIKSLNGLRAMAVIFVIIFHINPNLLPGGFLGVELFFVLSGYLIFSKIIIEIKKNKKLDLKQYIKKRLLRIIPAFYLMLSSITIFLNLTNKEWLIKIKKELLQSMIFNTNHYYIINKVPYFEKNSISSPLKHLWSLSIEFKFYFFIYILAMIILLLLNLLKKEKYFFEIIFIFLITISIYSIYKMNISYVGIESIDRIYYGFDTRIYSFCLGAIASFFQPIKKVSGKYIYDIISFILLTFIFISIFYIDEYNTNLYRYGFAIMSSIFSILIVSLLKSKFLNKLFEIKILDHLGELSYGLYLWHFCIFILTTPYEEYFSPNYTYYIFRVILTYVIALLSYNLIEKKFLKNGIKILKKPLNLILTIIVLSITILSYSNIIKEYFPYKLENDEKIDLNISIKKEEIEKIKEDIKKEEIEENVYNKVVVFGDSLGINISKSLSLAINNLIVDAKVGRQFVDSINLAEKYKEYNKKDTALIVVLGSNGLMLESEIYKLKEIFDKADIYLVNLNIPRRWNNKVNALYEKVSKESDIKLIDWYSISKDKRNWFVKDRVHINETGSKHMIELILNTLEKNVKNDENQKPILIIDHNKN